MKCGECKCFDKINYRCKFTRTQRGTDWNCILDKWLAERDAANGVDSEKRKLIDAYQLVAEDRKIRTGLNQDYWDLVEIADQLERELEAGNG